MPSGSVNISALDIYAASRAAKGTFLELRFHSTTLGRAFAMTNEDLAAELHALRNDLLSLRVERRGLMIALTAIIATHPRHEDCQLLMDHYLNAHLEHSETGQTLPDAAKEFLRDYVRSIQDAAGHQDSEAVQALRDKMSPWKRS